MITYSKTIERILGEMEVLKVCDTTSVTVVERMTLQYPHHVPTVL
jgi:hypothetical protein